MQVKMTKNTWMHQEGLCQGGGRHESRELMEHPLPNAKLPGGRALPQRCCQCHVEKEQPPGPGTASTARWEGAAWDLGGSTKGPESAASTAHRACKGELVGKREEPE